MSVAVAQILESLDTLGARCRDSLTTGHAAIVEAARLAVEARLRIEQQSETYPGGFKAWWGSYCTASPWSAPKLLTAGGWRVTKKTGVIAEPAAIEANVERIKADRAEHMREVRAAAKSSREPNPTAPTAAAANTQATIGTVRRDHKGEVLDPVPVVLKRAVFRLTKADELDRQIRKKLAEAVQQLTELGIPQGAEEMRQLLKLVDRAEQHRNGVVGELEAIVVDLSPAASDEATAQETPDPSTPAPEPVPPPVAAPANAAEPSLAIRPNGRAPVTKGRADCQLPNGCRYGGCVAMNKCLGVRAA